MTSIVHKEMQLQNNKELAQGLLHTPSKLETKQECEHQWLIRKRLTVSRRSKPTVFSGNMED